MQLHEIVEIDDDVKVMKVPGGVIYMFYEITPGFTDNRLKHVQFIKTPHKSK